MIDMNYEVKLEDFNKLNSLSEKDLTDLFPELTKRKYNYVSIGISTETIEAKITEKLDEIR